LSSLKVMRENNYKEADENYKCPNGFKTSGLRCESSLSWCEPKEKIEIDPMFYCDSKEDCILINFDCSSCDCDLKAVNKNYKKEICKNYTF